MSSVRYAISETTGYTSRIKFDVIIVIADYPGERFVAASDFVDAWAPGPPYRRRYVIVKDVENVLTGLYKMVPL